MSNPTPTPFAIGNPQSAIRWLLAAAILYAACAAYLYWPHVRALTGWRWLLPASACGAALGGFLLSRRWVAGFTGALVTGLLYGFGPFLLGLAKFHSTASLLAAAVPWLFVPATVLERKKGKWPSLPLWLLPFVVIALFFYLCAGQRLFAAPVQANIRPLDLAGFFVPVTTIGRSTALMGVYHVPVAALALGLVMVWKARRYSLLLIAAAGLALAFSRLFLDAGRIAWLGVSPILWLSIPMLWCSVLCGIGLHGLIEAGSADKRWILATVLLLGLLALVTLLLTTHYVQGVLKQADSHDSFRLQAAVIYLIGMATTGLVYLLASQNLRLHWLRWILLCTALGLDIVLSARYIVDHVL